MSEEPTGVFVRLPLSDDRREVFIAEMDSGAEAEQAILAIGTPVTGGKEICAGSVKWHENDVEPVLETYVPNTFGKGASVKIVTLSDHQAQIAALEAEVVRLRHYLERIDSLIMGNSDPVMMFCGIHASCTEALKGGAA